MRIANDMVVSIQFQLTNQAGQLLDSRPADEPLEYVHGAEGILPALEMALTGMAPGDNFDITITTSQGFGEHRQDLVQVVPRSVLGMTESDQLAVGRQVEQHDGAGAKSNFVITAFDDDTVTLDGNHPLAGMELHFRGTVVAVRAATAEELLETKSAQADL